MPAADDYLRRARLATRGFRATLAQFRRRVARRKPKPPKLPKSALNRLRKLLDQTDVAAAALEQSFALLGATGIDLVDLQSRLKRETARLASVLGALGDTVTGQHFIRDTFESDLVPLEEQAQALAGATFPSAAQGLEKANEKIWDFTRVQWTRYERVLADMVLRRRLSNQQVTQIETAAARVRAGFDDVNELLNELARGTLVDRAAVRMRAKRARRALAKSVAEAGRRRKTAFKAFRPMLKASAKTGEQLDRRLSMLRIPVFPAHAGLGELREMIDARAYHELSGIERFALLNIAARMRTVEVEGESLLSPDLRIRIFKVFPDRIYFRANRRLLDLIDVLLDGGTFEAAPAALHKFKDGSVKQTSFRKGNLQLSYARRPGGKVHVDADIDLYRDPLHHLFGEVLVNHLTGSKTSQFNVRRILERQGVALPAGFDILAA